MRRLVGYGVGLLLVLSVWADGGISPLAPRYEASLERPTRTRGVYAIRNVTVHPITTPPIEGATVLIRDGKIAAVGKNISLSRAAQSSTTARATISTPATSTRSPRWD
jgi:hypothetical protein